MFDVTAIRSRFPAVSSTTDAFLDGPGGTQVPQSVIDAMGRVLTAGISNEGGPFPSSELAVETTSQARHAIGDLFNCRPEEVVFGQNMTSLTFALSRAIAATWEDGDAIVVTSLDHDANFTPWVMAARDRGVDVRVAEMDIESGTLPPESVINQLDDRVRLVAIAYSSNALGTKVDLRPIIDAAHQVGALVFVDAVHAAPHHLLDVAALGCDFLAASVYKFFGPHTGVVFGREDHLAALSAYKVRPAPSDPPGKWETGTPSFESLAGVTAAVDYLASLGSHGATRRGSLAMAYESIENHEVELGRRFIDGLGSLPRARLWGVPTMTPDRGPTFAISVDGTDPKQVASHLARRGIYAWSGHYYAVNLMSRLGLLDEGGLVRIGFVHYNTAAEVDRSLEALAEI